MKTIELYLIDGTLLTLEIDAFDLVGFVSALNNSRILAVNVAGKVINKQLFRVIVEKIDADANVKISLNGGDYNAYTPTYDAELITKDINDPRTLFTLVGNVAFTKREFKQIDTI